MNEPEHLLWIHLRGRQQLGFKFRRQHGIGSYIVDFYCPKAKLVIEVDGDSHFDPKGMRHDKKRTAYLNKQDLKVLRFTNHEVRDKIDGVIEEILNHLQGATPLNPPLGRGEI